MKNQIELIPTKFANIFDVVLRLEFQTRHIGRLDLMGEGVFYTKRTSKHLHRKTNSLGVNLELLQRKDFRWIIILYEGKKLITTRNFILYHGTVLAFGKAGFEKQCFLRLDQWSEEKARAFEDGLEAQIDLFSAA